LSENIQRKLPKKWLNKHWALHDDNFSAHVSLVVQQFLAATNTTITQPSLLNEPVTFPIPQDKFDGKIASFLQY